MLHSITGISTRIMVLAATLVLGACASTPNTYSNVDSNADFSQYKTFGFFDHLATDRSDYESAESRYLKAAATREMNRRGLAYSVNPDLKVNFYINTKEKIRASQTPYAGGYYGYRDPYYYGAMGGYETRIDQYTEGTLNIDVVDVRTRKLVWEGAIVGRVTKEVRNNLEAVINQAVQEIFKPFPIPPGTIDKQPAQ